MKVNGLHLLDGVHFFVFLKNEWRFQIIFVIINIKSKLLQKVKVY